MMTVTTDAVLQMLYIHWRHTVRVFSGTGPAAIIVQQCRALEPSDSERLANDMPTRAETAVGIQSVVPESASHKLDNAVEDKYRVN